MGYRKSDRPAARWRRDRARYDIGYQNLAANNQTPGRNQRGWPSVPPVLPALPVLPMRPVPIMTTTNQGQVVEATGNQPPFRMRGWYPLVILATLGLGSFAPFAHAGARLGRPVVRVAGIGYTFVAVVAVTLLNFVPQDAAGSPVGTAGGVLFASGFLLFIGGPLAAISHLILLRRPTKVKPPEVDPALSKALAEKEKRKQARGLAASDPVLAQDLGIGRPDLGREYDDGGLVDINNAPAENIAANCGITQAQAEAIVELRAERGGFANVDEMLVLVDPPVSVWDRIRDRAITLSA
jgi:hypothetical protein